MVSLALKTVTQSVIVGKLSAYARKNKTKRALWEYDNIIRSLYLLDYVDSVPLRQNVQRALNRGESYHQLRRAVSHANFGKLRFKSEYEQQIWGDCGRLLTNCIIYYNASILSDLLIYREGLGDIDGVALLSLVSPVAWQGINFYGRYEFGKQPELNEESYEPLNSMCLRYKNDIVGWLITHCINNNTIRYTCTFVQKELQAFGLMFPLCIEAVKRHAIEFSNHKASWATPVSHESMISFAQRNLAPYTISSEQSKYSFKTLR
ncbi:MAG: hypothetical protein RLZZ535_1304 [Cyanobacteriota bacterium]